MPHFEYLLLLRKMLHLYCPISALGPGSKNLTVSFCSVSNTGNNFTLSPTAVLDQSLNVKCHFIQPHRINTRFHDSHQGLGLLAPKNLVFQITNRNLVETIDDVE